MNMQNGAQLGDSGEIVRSQMERVSSQFPDKKIKVLEEKLRRLKAEHVKTSSGENGSPEKRMLLRKKAGEYKEKARKIKEKSKGILRKGWDKIKGAISYVVGKVKDGFKAVLGWIKDHPILTILLLFVAAGIYYYSAPLAAGYSGMSEVAGGIVTSTARATLDVGPTVAAQGSIPTIVL